MPAQSFVNKKGNTRKIYYARSTRSGLTWWYKALLQHKYDKGPFKHRPTPDSDLGRVQDNIGTQEGLKMSDRVTMFALMHLAPFMQSLLLYENVPYVE